MADHQEQGTDETRTLSLSRRAWLAQTGCGFGGLALAAMMAERARRREADTGSKPAAAVPAPGKPHFTPRARQVIHVFLEGGPSHVDLFDPKPELSRQDGKPITVPGENRKAPAFGTAFPFSRHGKSGLELSALRCRTWVRWPTTCAWSARCTARRPPTTPRCC